jgi:BlaI family transcriptional regulator, penicillinase repressor
MAKKKLELSAAEWDIMNTVWMHPEAVTVRDVMDAAYPNDEKAYTTVQTLMNILVEKGVLRRKKAGMVIKYTPAVLRDAVLDASMNTVARRMFSGSFGAMASFLVSSNNLNDDDIAALRRLLDEKEREL